MASETMLLIEMFLVLDIDDEIIGCFPTATFSVIVSDIFVR